MFNFQQNGVRVRFQDTTTKSEIRANYIGSRSMYFVRAEPQDRFTAPADFNKSVSV